MTKSDQNTHQNAPNCTILKKEISRGGGMPPNPPSKVLGFANHSMSVRDMQISKSEKKNSWPLSQILSTPLQYVGC